VKGDKLLIEEGHIKAAEKIAVLLLPKIEESRGRFVVTIAGESGSGKSEIASALSDVLLKRGIKSAILQQDDYFVYPPKTNAGLRRKAISHVGLAEVRLDLLDQNLKDATDGKEQIVKPLVIFDTDQITEETLNLKGIKVIIIEGTYTTTLKNAQQHIFIDRTYIDTKEARKRRDREKQDSYLEQILEIEHLIISPHKIQADIIVKNNFDVINNDEFTGHK
jgi:uridine kinase